MDDVENFRRAFDSMCFMRRRTQDKGLMIVVGDCCGIFYDVRNPPKPKTRLTAVSRTEREIMLDGGFPKDDK